MSKLKDAIAHVDTMGLDRRYTGFGGDRWISVPEWAHDEILKAARSLLPPEPKNTVIVCFVENLAVPIMCNWEGETLLTLKDANEKVAEWQRRYPNNKYVTVTCPPRPEKVGSTMGMVT